MADKPKFNLDALIAETTLEPFTFELDGKTWEIPNLRTLTLEQGLALDTRSLADTLAEVAGPDLAERFRSLPGFAANALIGEWAEHAGTSEGESEGSANSSGSTAGPSKPTSAGTTGKNSLTSVKA